MPRTLDPKELKELKELLPERLHRWIEYVPGDPEPQSQGQVKDKATKRSAIEIALEGADSDE